MNGTKSTYCLNKTQLLIELKNYYIPNITIRWSNLKYSPMGVKKFTKKRKMRKLKNKRMKKNCMKMIVIQILIGKINKKYVIILNKLMKKQKNRKKL